MNAEVNQYLKDQENWKSELTELRRIILSCGLKEEYKWRNPCYTSKGKNVVLIGVSKETCSISFFKGSLLTDKKNILERIGKNTKSAKLISFNLLKEIQHLENTLKEYIQEAVEVEEKGLKVDYEKDKELEFPKELVNKFDTDPAYKAAFLSLTRGRQKGYVLHFSSAKQAKTRIARIERYEERILNGKGMLDCFCGLSKRMPNCDGSHRQLEK